MVSTTACSLSQMRESPPSCDGGLPIIVCLDSDDFTPTLRQHQHQYLLKRYGLRPAYAIIATELIFGGCGQ